LKNKGDANKHPLYFIREEPSHIAVFKSAKPSLHDENFKPITKYFYTTYKKSDKIIVVKI